MLLPEYMRHDYAALKHQLQETYGTLINDRVYYAGLMNRKKRKNEMVLAYLNDIKRLGGRLGAHISQRDQYICNAFLHGLPPKLLLHMGPMHNKSSSELLQAAMYYEQAFRRIDFVQEPPMPPVRVFNVGTAGASRPNYLNRQRPFFCCCFCCGKPGHIKRFCPHLENYFCPKCKSKGHLIDACNADNIPLNAQGLAPTRQ